MINEVVIPPLSTHANGFSSFPLNLLPIDFSIIGTAHSHPSGVLKPSIKDLNNFYGRIMVITSYPYDSEKDLAIFAKDGLPINFKMFE
jgi:proteasome lid subunit RPN8/RPN11